MSLHHKTNYSYVLTYTISNDDVAKDYLDFLKASQKDGGLEVGDPIDQSTYGTKLPFAPKELLKKLRAKLDALYVKYKVTDNGKMGDEAKLLCSASYFNSIQPATPKTDMLLYNIFDFE